MTPDAAFGFERQGTPETLAALGRERGFDVVVVPPFELDGRAGAQLGDPRGHRRRGPRRRRRAAGPARHDPRRDPRRSHRPRLAARVAARRDLPMPDRGRGQRGSSSPMAARRSKAPPDRLARSRSSCWAPRPRVGRRRRPAPPVGVLQRPGCHSGSATPRSRFSKRAITNSASDSRLRYGRTCSPIGSSWARLIVSRSARRHTVRATCSCAAPGEPPGNRKFVSGPTTRVQLVDQSPRAVRRDGAGRWGCARGVRRPPASTGPIPGRTARSGCARAPPPVAGSRRGPAPRRSGSSAHRPFRTPARGASPC